MFPRSLYKGDPNFISPLDKEIESVFDPEPNHFYNHGICNRWILKNENVTIGRIAAFINFEKNKNPELLLGELDFLNVQIMKQLHLNSLILQRNGWKKIMQKQWMAC